MGRALGRCLFFFFPFFFLFFISWWDHQKLRGEAPGGCFQQGGGLRERGLLQPQLSVCPSVRVCVIHPPCAPSRLFHRYLPTCTAPRGSRCPLPAAVSPPQPCFPPPAPRFPPGGLSSIPLCLPSCSPRTPPEPPGWGGIPEPCPSPRGTDARYEDLGAWGRGDNRLARLGCHRHGPAPR